MNRWRSETRLCCFLSPTLLDTSRICSVVAPGSGFAAVLPSDFVSAVARSRSGRSRQCVGRMEHQTLMYEDDDHENLGIWWQCHAHTAERGG